MLIINTENSVFDIFSLVFADFAPPPPPNAFGDIIFPFLLFGTFLTLCRIMILRNEVQNDNVKENYWRMISNTKISLFTYLLESFSCFFFVLFLLFCFVLIFLQHFQICTIWLNDQK